MVKGGEPLHDMLSREVLVAAGRRASSSAAALWGFICISAWRCCLRSVLASSSCAALRGLMPANHLPVSTGEFLRRISDSLTRHSH